MSKLDDQLLYEWERECDGLRLRIKELEAERDQLEKQVTQLQDDLSRACEISVKQWYCIQKVKRWRVSSSIDVQRLLDEVDDFLRAEQ